MNGGLPPRCKPLPMSGLLAAGIGKGMHGVAIGMDLPVGPGPSELRRQREHGRGLDHRVVVSMQAEHPCGDPVAVSIAGRAKRAVKLAHRSSLPVRARSSTHRPPNKTDGRHPRRIDLRFAASAPPPPWQHVAATTPCPASGVISAVFSSGVLPRAPLPYISTAKPRSPAVPARWPCPPRTPCARPSCARSRPPARASRWHHQARKPRRKLVVLVINRSGLDSHDGVSL